MVMMTMLLLFDCSKQEMQESVPTGLGESFVFYEDQGLSASTRVIAVDMPNSQTIGTVWCSYRTSVDAIEAATGLNILSNVSTTIQNVIEASVDNGTTS